MSVLLIIVQFIKMMRVTFIIVALTEPVFGQLIDWRFHPNGIRDLDQGSIIIVKEGTNEHVLNIKESPPRKMGEPVDIGGHLAFVGTN